MRRNRKTDEFARHSGFETELPIPGRYKPVFNTFASFEPPVLDMVSIRDNIMTISSDCSPPGHSFAGTIFAISALHDLAILLVKNHHLDIPDAPLETIPLPEKLEKYISGFASFGVSDGQLPLKDDALLDVYRLFETASLILVSMDIRFIDTLLVPGCYRVSATETYASTVLRHQIGKTRSVEVKKFEDIWFTHSPPDSSSTTRNYHYTDYEQSVGFNTCDFSSPLPALSTLGISLFHDHGPLPTLTPEDVKCLPGFIKDSLGSLSKQVKSVGLRPFMVNSLSPGSRGYEFSADSKLYDSSPHRQPPGSPPLPRVVSLLTQDEVLVLRTGLNHLSRAWIPNRVALNDGEDPVLLSSIVDLSSVGFGRIPPRKPPKKGSMPQSLSSS